MVYHRSYDNKFLVYQLENFNHKTGLELYSEIADISPEVEALWLGGNNLGHKTATELAQAFLAIQAKVVNLSLDNNNLDHLSGTELAQVLRAIPITVTELIMFLNGLGNKAGIELALAFQAIPAGVKTLDLSHNNLGRKTGAELAHILAAIPAGVTTLNLNCNNLGNISGPELARAFAAIPTTVKTLDLSNNEFGSKLSGLELRLVLAAIPAGVTTLNLVCRHFSNITGAQLARAIAGLPVGLTTLDLGGHSLSNKTGTELTLILAAIPSGVTTLNLDSNSLGDLTVSELIMALAAIPTGVTTLNLASTELIKKTGAELSLILDALPASISTLNLDTNQLGYMADAELALAAIPRNITTLILGGNSYGRDGTKLLLAIKVIPKSLTKIILSYDTLEQLTIAAWLVVKEALSQCRTLIDIECYGKISERSEEILNIQKEKIRQWKISNDSDNASLERIRVENTLSDSKALLSYVDQFDAKVRGISKLLDTYADINYQDEEDGYTALMLAVNNQNDQIAEYLLNEGANPFLRNKVDKIASDLASRSSPLFTILKGYELLYAVFNIDLITIKALLKSGADINFTGLGGYTPLLIAVEQNSIEMVDFLLSQNADLTIIRKDGQSVFDLVTDEYILELLEKANTTSEFSDESVQNDSAEQSASKHGFFW